VHHLATPY